MVSREDINIQLEKMILSASGWRGIFAANDNDVNNNEESIAERISSANRIICAAAAFVFVEYLRVTHKSSKNFSQRVKVLLGNDTRPTGRAIADVIISVLLARECEVRYAGFIAAPEIMAWARSKDGETAGFIYISASHNPVGYNGLKFGFTDGGVLAPDEAFELINIFHSFIKKNDFFDRIENIISSASHEQIKAVYSGIEACKSEALKVYDHFSGVVSFGSNEDIARALKDGLKKKPVGIVCDFNGSARTVSIDNNFFCTLGLKFDSINNVPGQIVHRIVPEGDSLEPCRQLLEKAHAKDASFVLGYVPDCDGDRGNLVFWDDKLNKARILEAQEVFALACVAELSHLVWTGEFVRSKAAIAVNDPTSTRIARIVEAFNIPVFRAEVGEANVVGLARNLRERGYTVRILGEGSAGGNITHPSAVRDPLNTVLAIVKLLTVNSGAGKPGLFEIWCKLSGLEEKYRDKFDCNFNLSDIIESLPEFITTSAYSDDAVMKVNTKDHSLLKSRYQKFFLKEWEDKKDELRRYGFFGWEAIAYNGREERRKLKRFGDAGNGGLKICLLDEKGGERAFIWMRGSATEPVFRIMADVDCSEISFDDGKEIERFLLDWQRRMIIEADKE
jgi:phosphoglucomutase